MNDSPTTSGVRAPVALLAALGALLVGLAGGAASGGMLAYVAGLDDKLAERNPFYFDQRRQRIRRAGVR